MTKNSAVSEPKRDKTEKQTKKKYIVTHKKLNLNNLLDTHAKHVLYFNTQSNSTAMAMNFASYFVTYLSVNMYKLSFVCVEVRKSSVS